MMEIVLEKLRKLYINIFAKEWFIFLFGFLVLILPYSFRGFYLHGQESYFYYRISNIILESNLPNYDFFSFGGRAFLYSLGSPLTLVLVSLIFNISVYNLLIFLPILFGFLSLVLFYYILKHFKVNENILSISCYLLILSPVFLYGFTHFTSFTIPLFLNLLGFFLILKEKKVISFLIYLVLPFFGFIHVFFGLSLLFFYFYKFKMLKRFIPYTFIILFTIYLSNIFLEIGVDAFNYKFYELFFILGGEYGLSIFLLILSFFGAINLWEKKYENLFYYLFFGLSIFILVLDIKNIIYVNFILCILGAFGLRYIYKLKWNSILVRNLTVILLLGGILFSSFLFLIDNSQEDPRQEIYNALLFLREKTNPRDVILSYEKYGIYINSISQRKNFIDTNYAYAPRLELREFYLNKIYYSRDLDKTLNIFKEFKIDYVFITPEMKDGLVWGGNNEGLLFLLNNNPKNFKLIYDKDSVEIWGVL